MLSKCVAEFMGTFFLVLTVGLNALGASPATPWSAAAALMCMIFALGDVSGAHFNPAVTLAILCSGRSERTNFTAKDAALYIPVQIVGGIFAAFTYSSMMNGETFALKPAGYKWSQALLAEFVFTFVLAYVVLTVATVKSSLTQYFAFAIGMCVTVGGVAIGKVSGGSLNPAVSIGISTSHILGGGNFWPCLIYMLVEIAGGCCAAGIFKVTHPSEYDESAKI